MNQRHCWPLLGGRIAPFASLMAIVSPSACAKGRVVTKVTLPACWLALASWPVAPIGPV